jgi:hypothetical protein
LFTNALHHPLEAHYDSLVGEPQQSYQGSTSVTYKPVRSIKKSQSTFGSAKWFWPEFD